MNFREELIQRCAAARKNKLGGLSDAAYEELLLAVRADVDSFVENPPEQALAILARAMERYEDSREDDELREDDEYMAERTRRLQAVKEAAKQALEVDPGNVDARLILSQATTLQPDKLLDMLIAIEQEPAGVAGGDGERGDEAPLAPFTSLSWENLNDRPRLRLRAAIARTCASGARWKMALEAASAVLAQTADAGDPLGARHTAAVAYARLEDEDGLNALEARFSQGSPWGNLARCILLYKLDRLPAARRALRGYAQLSDGGAYALLRPIFVDVYLPDRPDHPRGSFEEALCAVHESEVVIADTPDFVAWAQSQDWFEADAKAYARRHDFDW